MKTLDELIEEARIAKNDDAIFNPGSQRCEESKYIFLRLIEEKNRRAMKNETIEQLKDMIYESAKSYHNAKTEKERLEHRLTFNKLMREKRRLQEAQ